jgi:hypothetical protein
MHRNNEKSEDNSGGLGLRGTVLIQIIIDDVSLLNPIKETYKLFLLRQKFDIRFIVS